MPTLIFEQVQKKLKVFVSDEARAHGFELIGITQPDDIPAAGKRLKQIASQLTARAGENVKVFVYTAPMMGKPLAAAAGLGWQGKNTNLVSRSFESWLFLGSIFTTAELPFDAAEIDRYSSCRAYLDSCPTNTFTAPYQLDARRCISYLTIELKEQIPIRFRRPIGNRIYGCDDCLAACPWNKFASLTREIRLQAQEELEAPVLFVLLALDDHAFRHLFSGSPVKRIGRGRFIRNVLVAAGNSGDRTLLSQIIPHLADPSPLVCGMVVWALVAQLLSPKQFAALRQQSVSYETDDSVRGEWETEA